MSPTVVEGPTRSKGESGTVMPCWSLMVELAAWAGCGHQAGANRQATGEAGHRDGHQRPQDQRSRLARFQEVQLGSDVAAATGTPNWAEANAPIGSGWPVSRIAAWVAADLHKPELSQFSAVDTDHHHGWAELLESVIVSFLGP
jgi:hypothetical protein